MSEQANPLSEAQLPPSAPWWLKIWFGVGFSTGLCVLLIAGMFGWIPSPLLERMKTQEYQLWQILYTQRVMCNAMLSLLEQQAKPLGNTCEPWKLDQRASFKEPKFNGQ